MTSHTRKKTRCANNEGSIYKRSDGKWCSQVTIGYHPDTGSPIRKTFYGKTQLEVKEKKNEALQKIRAGQPIPASSDCMAVDYIKSWLLTYKRTTVTGRTFEWYSNILGKHIYPAFNSTKLRDLSSDMIQTLLTECLNAKKLKLRTVKSIRNILNQALKHAVSQGIITVNPVNNTCLPRSDRRIMPVEKQPIPKDLQKKLLDAAEQDIIMEPIIKTLLYTGVRTEELLGLIWKNVDFKTHTITIDRALTLVPEFDEKGKRISRNSDIGPTKTVSGTRQISVPPVVTEALLKWKDHLQVKKPELVDPDKVVFVSQKGDIRTYNGFRTSYRHFLERNGLEDQKLNLHRYRHTFATTMLENKVNPRVVQKLLGHKDIETTLGIYSHVTQDVFEDVAEMLEKVYKDTKKDEKTCNDEGSKPQYNGLRKLDKKAA